MLIITGNLTANLLLDNDMVFYRIRAGNPGRGWSKKGNYALTHGSVFMAFLFGYLAYGSYATLQAYTGRRGW